MRQDQAEEHSSDLMADHDTARTARMNRVHQQHRDRPDARDTKSNALRRNPSVIGPYLRGEGRGRGVGVIGLETFFDIHFDHLRGAEGVLRTWLASNPPTRNCGSYEKSGGHATRPVPGAVERGR